MIYITTVPFIYVLGFFGLIIAFLVLDIAYLIMNINKYKPQIDEALSQKDDAIKIAEDIYAKSSMILPLFEKLQKLTYDYTNAAASGNISKGDISNEDAQRLIGDIKVIAEDPAVLEFRKMIEGYTCSNQ